MKGSRKVHEFTPEQMRNLTAIVWLYCGQAERFLSLVVSYFQQHVTECSVLPAEIAGFNTALSSLDADFAWLGQLRLRAGYRLRIHNKEQLLLAGRFRTRTASAV